MVSFVGPDRHINFGEARGGTLALSGVNAVGFKETDIDLYGTQTM